MSGQSVSQSVLHGSSMDLGVDENENENEMSRNMNPVHFPLHISKRFGLCQGTMIACMQLVAAGRVQTS